MYKYIIALLISLQLTSAAFAQCVTPDRAVLDTLTSSERAAMRRAAVNVPNPQGLMWEAVREDTTITLFGTMHIPLTDRKRAAFMPAIEARIGNADLFMMEITSEDEARLVGALFANPDVFTMPGRQLLSDHLSEAEWAQLEAAYTARGVPLFMGRVFQPWYAGLILSLPACVMQQMAEGVVIMDKEIEALALSHGLTPRSLDQDVNALFATLRRDSLEEELESLRFALTLAEDLRGFFNAMDALYMDEATQMIWEFNRVWAQEIWTGDPAIPATQLDEVQRVLLDERNQNWMVEIEAALAEHRDIFISVGALHLPGEAGLVARLEAEGFTIARLPLTNTAD